MRVFRVRPPVLALLAALGCGGATEQSPPAQDSMPLQDAIDATDAIDMGDAPAEAAPDGVPTDAADVIDGDAGFAEDPVLFVHGYAVDGSWWDPAIKHFEAAGYPKGWVRAISFSDNRGSVIDQAAELETYVEKLCLELSVSKIDLIAHSMGGLSSRYYIAFRKGKDRVRDYVSFSGAHHGTSTACATFFPGAMQMCPPYATATTTVQYTLNGDPAVADVDETPFGSEDGGSVYWNVFWSDGDLIILPNDSGCLNQKSKGDCTDAVNTLFPGVLHSDMNKNVKMLDEALVRVRRHKPSKP